jgi:hypothetical protein
MAQPVQVLGQVLETVGVKAGTAELLLGGGARLDEDTFLRLVALSASIFIVLRVVTALLFTPLVRSLDPKDQSEALGRIVSTVHAVISTLLAYAAVSEDNFRFLDLFDPNEPLWREMRGMQGFAMAVTGGYFLYDMLHDFAFNFPRDLTGLSMMVHHVVSLLTYLISTCSHPATGVILALSLQTMEITTPLFNLRWLLVKTGKTSGPVFTATNYLFALGFLIFRVTVGALLGVVLVFMPTDGLPMLILNKGLGYIFISLQFLWFSGLVKSLSRKPKNKKH